MRRSIHANIYNDHRRTKCKKDGEQTSNLTEEQQAGLKSLKKRIEEKEIVVLKTDKSTKLCVATMEEYIKMGQKHTKNDKQVYRREIQEIEKNINGHTFAWSKMWDTGGEHGHLGRVIDSKVSHSENVSIMYVVYKDHKKDPGESRPIVTGNSGHTRGLSNSVSNFLESIANAIANPFECISTEDMLSNTKKANKLIKEIIKEWQARRLPKLNCNTCNYKQEETRTCNDCMQTGPEEDGDNAQDKMETQYDCDHCGREWRDRMEEDCVECGPGIFWEDQEICLLGLDVVALFPSMSSETTGKIIRKHVLLSPIKIEGFDWRQGARYVLVNKRYTSDLACLWGILPFRRKDKGTAPGMKSKDINSKKGDIEKQWIFPKKPTDQQIREIQARCAEIATRFLFQNFCYKFQGNTYLQSKGGPIGARVTMAAARIVMSDWGEEWRKLIEAAGVKLPQLDGYVDDVRNRSTSLRFGTKWNDNEKKFTWTREDMVEDKRRKYEEKETTNARMAKLCLPAINSVNRDLVFTAEIPEDFKDNKLPTLDFFLWLEKRGLLNHSFFQKPMKTPLVLMAQSAMSDNQRHSILAQELIRRLSNTNHEVEDIEERTTIMETFIQQLKSSGYTRKVTREIVVSGTTGWKRKIRRRQEDGLDFYRSAKSTLAKRCRKKLLEKANWFKAKRKREDDHQEERKASPKKRIRLGHQDRDQEQIQDRNKDNTNSMKENVKAVMFVPFTEGSALAKRMREAESNLQEMTGYRLKIVERAGTKLEDILDKQIPGKDRIVAAPCAYSVKQNRELGSIQARTAPGAVWCTRVGA